MSNIFETIFTDIKAAFVSAWAAITHANWTAITADTAEYATLIGNGLEDALKAFTALTGKDTTNLQASANNIVTALKGITAGIATNLALPIVQQVSADWAVFSADVKPLIADLPAAVNETLTAISTVLPYLTAAVGLVGSDEALASQNSGMTVDEAKVILAAAA